MLALRARVYGAIFAVLLLGGASGCSASVTIGNPATNSDSRAFAAAATKQPQRPGTCESPPPEVNFPTGEWTARETILTTSAVDACAGE